MKRRELFTTALAAAAGGCAAQQHVHRDGALPYGTLDHMDRGLAKITDPFRGFVRRESGDRELAIPDENRELLIGSMKTLFMAGAMHDLPVEARRHPDVQQRFASIVPEAARSLYGMTMAMDRITPAERVMMQRSLARDPELPLRAAEHMDRLAVSVDLGMTSRYKLRGLATDTAWRLGHQPVSLFLDETTQRVFKAEKRAGEWAAQNRSMLALAMQEEGEWEDEVEYEEYEEYEEEAVQERPRERRPWKGRSIAIVGGALGIVGLIGGYVALIWGYANSFGNGSSTGPLTLAAISGVTFVAGIITMIVGLVIKGQQDREWLERNPKPRRRRRR